MASSSKPPSPTSQVATLSDAITDELLKSSNDSQQSFEIRGVIADSEVINTQLLFAYRENQPESSNGPLSPTLKRAVGPTINALHAVQQQLSDTLNNAQTSSESPIQSTETTLTPTATPQNGTEGHIMISYNRATCTGIAQQIYQRLVAEGYRVWIDTEDLHGRILRGMAQGLENSYIVILLMNRQYYESEYCEREATQAAEQHIDIIPCVMEPNFDLTGWLRTAIGDRLRIDFFSPNPFDAAFRRLIIEIDHIKKQIAIREAQRAATLTSQARVEDIIRNYMASINRINQELESLTREELLELVTRLRRELSTNANVSNEGEGDASQQTNQILQQLLAQSTNQRDLLRRAIELLSTSNTTGIIINVFSIILFLWTTFQFLHKSFSQ